MDNTGRGEGKKERDILKVMLEREEIERRKT